MPLTFPNLSELDFVKHAFSTRIGGVSDNEFNSMNLAFGRGDSDENVRKNYKLMCDAVGLDYSTLVSSAQDHHTFVRKVTSADCGIGIERPKDMLSVDGLMTNEPNVTLVTHYADCTPLLLLTLKSMLSQLHTQAGEVQQAEWGRSQLSE